MGHNRATTNATHILGTLKAVRAHYAKQQMGEIDKETPAYVEFDKLEAVAAMEGGGSGGPGAAGAGPSGAGGTKQLAPLWQGRGGQGGPPQAAAAYGRQGGFALLLRYTLPMCLEDFPSHALLAH